VRRTANLMTTPNTKDLALVMTGGGARAAYQVGFLRTICRLVPDFEPEILTGVSAGAINATYLASAPGPFAERVEGLADLWCRLEPKDVMNVRAVQFSRLMLQWLARLGSGGRYKGNHGLIDSSPLRKTMTEALGSGELTGITRNINEGRLKSFAVTAASYSTGQTVTFYEGRDIKGWERVNRRSRRAPITVEHVMASAALPFLFPAISLGDGWYGDGGIRLTSPFAPAIHLGAGRILAISTRRGRSIKEADRPVIDAYPAPSRVASLVLNAIFLDQLDGDAHQLHRINRLLGHIPEEVHGRLRPVDLQVWRPSMDLGELANDYEARLPWALRFLMRGTGTKESRSNDFLSMIMFQGDYLSRLVTSGEQDAEEHRDEILAFLAN
jgi:NTE family protein